MEGDRFGNASTAALLEREMQERLELEELRQEIRRRLIAESGVIIGKVYRVADDGRLCAGRMILVEGINAGMKGLPGREEFYCFAWGRMNGKSAAGDGWTIRRQNITASRLTITDPRTP